MSALTISKEDEKRVNEVNKVTNIIKEKIKPLIKYIKADVFDNELIMSQELVINKKDNVLAKCDLSTKNKILEIKALKQLKKEKHIKKKMVKLLIQKEH